MRIIRFDADASRSKTMQAIDEGVPFVIQVSDARGSSLETLFPTLVGITPEAAGLIVPPASIATLRATMFYPIHMGYRAKGRAGPDGFEIDVQPPGAA